jgi:regulator of replication initiation timing
LFQDLDVMKDKFVVWETQMTHLDHHLDLKTAAEFLGEQVKLAFNNIILVLMGVMDTQAQMSKSQKEIDWLRNTLTHLSHNDDLKVTYTNGYHVNAAVTHTSRILLDESCF